MLRVLDTPVSEPFEHGIAVGARKEGIDGLWGDEATHESLPLRRVVHERNLLARGDGPRCGAGDRVAHAGARATAVTARRPVEEVLAWVSANYQSEQPLRPQWRPSIRFARVNRNPYHSSAQEPLYGPGKRFSGLRLSQGS